MVGKKRDLEVGLAQYAYDLECATNDLLRWSINQDFICEHLRASAVEISELPMQHRPRRQIEY